MQFAKSPPSLVCRQATGNSETGDFMDYLYIPVGMFVIFIAFLNRDLLARRRTFVLILVISIVLFLTGIVLHFIERDSDSSSGALLTPLVTLALYRLCRRLFLRKADHE